MVAKKKHGDHGGMLSLQQALYHAVHDYRDGMGLRSFCADFGIESPEYFGQKVSLREGSPSLTLRDMQLILEATRDPRILTALCGPVDAVWNWSGAVADAPADMDVLKVGAGLMTAPVAAVNELVAAIENDGVVDDGEMARIKQGAFEIRKAIDLLERTAEGFRG